MIEPTVYLIDRCAADGPAQHGRAALLDALQAYQVAVRPIHLWTQAAQAHTVLVAGMTSDRLVRRLLAAGGSLVQERHEGVIYCRCQADAVEILIVAGTDARGLMYALLEMAERVRLGGIRALIETEPLIEFPDHPVRGMDRFVTGPLDDEWFHSDAFWAYYLGQLARCRFNRLVLVTGFDTAYLSPPYPFFIEVPGYPQVGVQDLDDMGRARNLARLQAIGRACHEHGIEFILGTWQQRPWTANQQRLVIGLPDQEDALADYCAQGLQELLRACPEIDGVHFRVNHEAGMGGRQSNEAFWHQMIQSVAAVDRPVQIDLRAKGLTDGMIHFAMECGLDVAVPTKYWCEHTGLPYHLSQMRAEELTQLDNLNHSRRYSYADMLRKPRWYDILYRLWNLGSTCLFLWGDADYVLRFSQSCYLGDAAGYEVSAPLSLKGGHALIQGDPWPLFDAPEMRAGEWEDERYWLYYLFFGRLGYSAHTAAEVWQREFRARFGEAAAHVETAYRFASKVLPLITASHMPVHPMVHYWPEMSTGGALFGEHNANPHFKQISYLEAEPSDPGLFYRIADYVRDRLENNPQPRYTPHQVRDWLRHFAAQVRQAIQAADACEGIDARLEYPGTRLDMLMLADLAAYHAHKIEAAVALGYYNGTGDPDHLRTTYACALAARESWAALAARGIGAYHRPLQFSVGNGTGRSGHWQDYLVELDRDVDRLRVMLQQARREVSMREPGTPLLGELGGGTMSLPPLEVEVATTCRAGEDLRVVVRAGELADFPSGLNLHYRHTNQAEGPFHMVSMQGSGARYEGVISGEYLTPEWDLLIYLSAVGQQGQTVIWPGLYHPAHPLPYLVVRVSQ